MAITFVTQLVDTCARLFLEKTEEGTPAREDLSAEEILREHFRRPDGSEPFALPQDMVMEVRKRLPLIRKKLEDRNIRAALMRSEYFQRCVRKGLQPEELRSESGTKPELDWWLSHRAPFSAGLSVRAKFVSAAIQLNGSSAASKMRLSADRAIMLGILEKLSREDALNIVIELFRGALPDRREELDDLCGRLIEDKSKPLSDCLQSVFRLIAEPQETIDEDSDETGDEKGGEEKPPTE